MTSRFLVVGINDSMPDISGIEGAPTLNEAKEIAAQYVNEYGYDSVSIYENKMTAKAPVPEVEFTNVR